MSRDAHPKNKRMWVIKHTRKSSKDLEMTSDISGSTRTKCGSIR